MSVVSVEQQSEQSDGEPGKRKESWLQRNRPYRWGQRTARVTERLIAEASDHPNSSRKWAVGFAVGAVATAGVAYGAATSFEQVVTEQSFGALVEGLGLVAMADYTLGTTREMLAIYRPKHEAARWHEHAPGQERVA